MLIRLSSAFARDMPKKHNRRRGGTQQPSDPAPISGRGGSTHSRPASDVGGSGDGQSQKICYEFQSNGSCKVGDKCCYSHKVPNSRRKNTNSASGSPQSPQGHQMAGASPHHASGTIVEFLNRVQKALLPSRFRLDISKPRDLELWMQCWAAVGKGAEAHHACTLARAIMRFPATTILAPPPNDVLSVLLTLVHSFAKQTQSATSLVETLELAADVVENRLRSYPAEIPLHVRSDCEAKTEELRSISHGAIFRSISDPSLATRGAILVTRLLPLLDGLVCSYKRQITDDTEQDHDIAVEADDRTWSGWRTPTLAWLQKGEWLDAPHLIRSSDGVDHYIHTLRRLVTMLTFYWGAGAVFPKCQTRGQDDQSCRRPLCTVTSKARQKKCRRRLSGGKICMRRAHWRCSRHGHDVACQRCLAEQQHELTSYPGPRASTDVYDCLVERDTVRRDAVVYILSQMKSRKPPSVAPHWRTTYRLKCSALVAVMRLGVSGEPLSSQRALQWAEVVPVNQNSGLGKDFYERSRGRLALRLLNRADVSTLPQNEEGLERGTWVAVIDLQVLVPEVISVLSTITDVEFHSHLEQLLFSDVLIGSRGIRTEPTAHTSIEQAIESALAISKIDLIKRLPENIRSDLSRSLVRLAKNTNLYGTQLQALSASLSSALHCTQGPPGSGKSYVGVVLVRALDIVRTYATKSGMSVGPIVVLSYKNHPLDEFLLDVMKAEGGHSSLVRGMIRCGKPEDERLHQYCERRNPVEIRAQETLSRRVASLRAVKRVLGSWRKVQEEFGESFVEQAQRLKTLRTMEVKTSLAFGERVYDAVLVLAHALLLHGRVNAADSCNELNSATAYGLIQSLLRDDLSTLDLHHDVIEHLGSLNNGTEHWLTRGKSRMVFLLVNWLSGSNPPPRCAASNEAGGCVMASTAPEAYCTEVHKCLHKIGCGARRVNSIPWCGDHRCQFDDSNEKCALLCLADGNFCSEHACPLCVRSNDGPVLSRHIGNAGCSKHTCSVDMCNCLSLAPGLLPCETHCCSVCRHFALSDQRPGHVKSLTCVGSSEFCKEHKCEAPNCDQFRILCFDSEPQLYCKNHACIACTGRRNLVDQAGGHSHLCNQHLCAHDSSLTCLRRRDEASKCCDLHTCGYCRQERAPLDQAVVDEVPRNVFKNHTLCDFILQNGSMCSTLDENSSYSNFCKRHLRINVKVGVGKSEFIRKSKCCGLTKRKRRCQTTGLGMSGQKDYCDSHVDQNSQSSGDSSNEKQFINSDSSAAVEVDNFQESEMFLSYAELTKRVTQDATLNPDQGGISKRKIDSAELLTDSAPHYSGQDNHTVLATPAEVRCAGITTKKKPCKTVGNASHGSTFFCNAHSAQKPTSVHNDRWCEGTVISTIDYNQKQAEVESVISGYLSSSDEWSWSQSHSKRWSLVSEFLGGVILSIDELVVLAEDHVELARQERQEAAAYAFKKAKLIGSTIVGATGRLQAIRASEPFAMVVEEACEVLEPTLVSVLAVRSLRKLELIRNHRQLPAFVQPCRFPIQVNLRSTKMSLLERLVESGASGGTGRTIHCTILDKQRRMRPEISALTKCEYEDVVNIIDLACTLSQRKGDCQLQPTIKRTRSSLKDKELEPELSSERNLWYGQGNVVPGLDSAVFFWEIEGKEERASVGLSRCNNAEAEFCAGLVKWLLQCGVAPAGITVLTPFKGQKITIVKKLRRVPGALLGETDGTKGASRNEVTVSTVDCYQGDENDVVILSLVCTRPDNLFIASQKQIIVAASRAHIGFYILGSPRAFPSNHQNGSAPLHWLRLLKDLECSHTNAGQGANAGIMGQRSRMGRKLDIRCPRHPDSSKEISTPSDFPAKREELTSFCSKPCAFSLPWCSHLCQEPCHSPSQRQHTSKCKMLVPRPCDSHSEISLHCCNVRQKQNMEAESLRDALNNFHCEVIVPYHRPECSHVLKISCHQYMGILDGSLKLKNCEKAVADYVHPVCGHRSLGPSCHRRRQWENEPPMCKVAVDHIRSCGCEVRLPCHDKVQECAMIEAPLCQEAVSKPRPRCSHLLSSRCYESLALQELWSQEEDEAVNSDPPVIRYGIIYGPSEADVSQASPSRFTKVFKECFVETKYHASCGHTSIALCSKAFKLSAGTIDEPPCTEKVIFRSPICGHQIESQCYLRTACRDLANTVFEERVNLAPGQVQRFAQERMLRAAPSLDPILSKLRNACSCSVVIGRECGHETSAFSCSRIFASLRNKIFPSCSAPVVLKRPCGHPCTTSCHHRGNTLPVCSESVDEVFNYSCGKSGHTLQPKTCHHLRLLQASTDIQCPLQVKTVRARCGHAFELPCHMEGKLRKKTPGSCLDAKVSPRIVHEGTDYCKGALGIPGCLERVSYRRMCGHEDRDVQCDIAFEWAALPQEAPACRHEIAIKSPLCEHQLLIACNLKADILAADLWRGQPLERITLSMHDEVRTCPVVQEDMQLPALPTLQTIALLRCGDSTLLQRKCGHEKTVPCETIFTAMTSICKELENVECAGCGQTSAQPCHELKKSPDSLRCNRVVKKKCPVCRINITPLPCYMEAVQCGSEVNTNLQCGHEIAWQCGDEDPRRKPLMKVCIVCTHKRWLDVNATVSLQKEMAAKASSRNKKTAILANAAENRLHGANSCDIFDFNALLDVLRSRALENFPESWIMKCVEVECIPVERLLQSYLQLLQQNIDNFAAAIRNGKREELRLCAPPQFPGEDGAYDIIYCTRTSKEEPEDCFRSLMTRYGMGITGKTLSEKSIVHESEKRRHSGPWSIFVGAVLRHQMLDDVEPFMAQVRSDCRQTEARKKALKLMQSCRAKGYDHISLKPMGEPFGRVFWTAGSVVPLYQIELQFHRQCEICMDNIPALKAWGCPDDHFLCGECFGSYAKSAQEPGTLRRIVDQDGNLACPHDGCMRTYDILHLLRQRQDASEEELQPLQSELEKLKIATHAKRHVKAALDVQKMELEAEFRRIQQIQDLDERRAEILRLEIVDQILTLRCPNCRTAFIDFDGCFDLTCNGCTHHFCAWCISHFSPDDVHSHVLHCPKSPALGMVYGRMEDFTLLHSKRRRQLIVQRLKSEVRQVQKLTLARVRGELQDLDIHIKLDQLVTG